MNLDRATNLRGFSRGLRGMFVAPCKVRVCKGLVGGSLCWNDEVIEI